MHKSFIIILRMWCNVHNLIRECFSRSHCLIIFTQNALIQTNTDKSSSYTLHMFILISAVCSLKYLLQLADIPNITA